MLFHLKLFAGQGVVYIISSIIIGMAIGVFSIKHQKAFLAILFALPPLYIMAVKLFAPFAAIVQTQDVGNGSVLSIFMTLFDRLPEDMQTAAIIFPIAVIASRLVTWLYTKFAKPPADETGAERKKRILAEYGYKDGLPY